MKTIPDAEPAVKVELIRAAAERNIVDAVDLLLKMSKDPDGQVRIEALKSLAVLARPDRIPALLERLSAIERDTERREAERTVIAVARKIPEQKQQGDPVLEALPAAESEPYRASLLQILGRIGDTDALPALRDALTDSRESVRTAAIRALSDWPGPAPLDDLYKIARGSDSEIERVLAVRGIISLIETGDWPAEKRVDHYSNAMELASATNEKNMVLSGLAKFPSPEALAMAENALEDQALRGAAEVAVVQIARSISDDHPDIAQKACEQLLKTTKRENVREDAEGVLERIERNQ
jgi:HEAT repeat protein